jgi:hypothetical protein
MSICNQTQQECRDPQRCLQAGCVGLQLSQPPQQPDKLKQGADAIRERIKKLKAIGKTEREYAQFRLDELDAHGLWDSAIAIAEWEIEKDALIWALKQMEMEE